MKQKFTLSRSNYIYYYIVGALLLIRFLVYAEKTAYNFGTISGQLIATLLIPSLFAWVAWFVSRKNPKGATWTFNLMLTVVLLSQIYDFTRTRQQAQELIAIQNQNEKLKQVASTTDDPQELDEAFDNYTNTAKNSFDALSEKSTGSEKQFFEIMRVFVSDIQSVVKNWRTSFDAVQDPTILDYALLTTDEEFERQKKILINYVEQTKTYNAFFANMVPNLKKQLSALGAGNKQAKEALEGATNKYLLQKPLFEPLMQAHLEYGNSMIQILELLQNNKDLWIFENNELVFHSDHVESEYHKHFESFAGSETTINTLSEKLLEKL